MKGTKKAKKWRVVRVEQEAYLKIQKRARSLGVSISKMIEINSNEQI